MATILDLVLGADSGYTALLTKVNNLIRRRHSFDDATKVGDYAVQADVDQHVIYDAAAAARACTLPNPATSPNRSYLISSKSVAGGNVTLAVSGGANIKGAASYVISTAYKTVRVTCDAAEYFVQD